MTRYGQQFGPDFTFLGCRCATREPQSYAGADIVIVGAPFDGGASHRSGTRFGPMAIRGTDYLPHDGSRPSLALRTDALRDLVVVDAGDVEMPPGDIEKALRARGSRDESRCRRGDPGRARWRPLIAFPDAKGLRQCPGPRQGVDDPFRCPCGHRRHHLWLVVGHGQPMRRLIESGALRADRFSRSD